MSAYSRELSGKRVMACLALLISLFCGTGAAWAQHYSELSAARVHEIAGMLGGQPSGFGVPCSDRTVWQGKAADLESSTAEAEHVLGEPLPPFDAAAYLAFTESGDRLRMQRNLLSRQDQLVPLVLAECAEDKGRFLPRIDEVMDSLAAMPSWTLSAHDPKLLNFHGVRYSVDLNAADMADNLAEALYLLGDKIPATTRRHVEAQMEKHVFGPMRQAFERAGNSADGVDNEGWLYVDMNWNAVCLKGVTGAALAVLPARRDRALFVAAAEHYVQHYEAGFQPDGYETEGLGYWNYGFSHYIELRENLFRVTSGRIDLLADPKMRKVALFGIEFPMMPGNAAAFGDSGTMPKADPHLLTVIDHIFQLPLANAEKTLRSTGVQHAGLTSMTLDMFPVPHDQLPTPSELSRHNLHVYYADSGVLVSYPAPGQHLAVTIKAGGNTTHSHNDVGSFAIGLGNAQPVGDPGGPHFYTGATFGPHRLDSRLLNSFGHPVPEIGGSLQLDATKVKVSVIDHAFSAAEDQLTIDMTNAYKVPELKSVTRTLVHSRAGDGSIEIIDKFHLTKGTEIIESLPTHGTWKEIDSKTLLFTDGGEKLRVAVEATAPFTIAETKVDEYGNPFTRVEIHVPLNMSGQVKLRFTPTT